MRDLGPGLSLVIDRYILVRLGCLNHGLCRVLKVLTPAGHGPVMSYSGSDSEQTRAKNNLNDDVREHSLTLDTAHQSNPDPGLKSMIGHLDG